MYLGNGRPIITSWSFQRSALLSKRYDSRPEFESNNISPVRNRIGNFQKYDGPIVKKKNETIRTYSRVLLRTRCTNYAPETEIRARRSFVMTNSYRAIITVIIVSNVCCIRHVCVYIYSSTDKRCIQFARGYRNRLAENVVKFETPVISKRMTCAGSITNNFNIPTAQKK